MSVQWFVCEVQNEVGQQKTQENAKETAKRHKSIQVGWNCARDPDLLCPDPSIVRVRTCEGIVVYNAGYAVL